MNAGLLRTVARHLRGHADGAPPDADLLRRFVRERDERAFEELVRRHGPLVWGVCRRALANRADAEDAFQATFLVLAKNPRAVRKPAALGCWLYGVARRVAHRMRNRAKPSPLANEPAAADATDQITVRELLTVLDDELARLPERERGPLVLCFLQERTQDEAARQLGVSLSTLKRRLDAGRETLRARLTRRGVDLTAALAATAIGGGVTASAAVVDTTVGLAGGGTMASAGAITVAEGVLKTMTHTKLKAWAAGLVMAATAAGGTGYVAIAGAGQGGGDGPGPNLAQAAPAGGLPGGVGAQRGQPGPATPVTGLPGPQTLVVPPDQKQLELEVKLAEVEYEGIARELDAHQHQLDLLSKLPGSAVFEQAGLTATVSRLRREAEVAKVKIEMARHRLTVAAGQAPAVSKPAAEPPSTARAPVADLKLLELDLRQAMADLTYAKTSYESQAKQAGLLKEANSPLTERLAAEQAMNKARHEIELAEIRLDAAKHRYQQAKQAADQPAPVPPAAQPKPAATAGSSEVRKLREEMLKATREAMKLDRVQMEQGGGRRPADQPVYLAATYRRSRTILELERSLNPGDRSKAAKDHYDRMKELETYFTALVQAGAITAQLALDAKVYRLEAEVWVKQAEAGPHSMLAPEEDVPPGNLLGLAPIPGHLDERIPRNADELRGLFERSRPRATLPAQFRGTVQKYDRESGYVTLSPGLDAGVQVGGVMSLYRIEGNEGRYLGKVTVLSTDPKQAVGRFVPADPRKKSEPDDLPKPGDNLKPSDRD